MSSDCPLEYIKALCHLLGLYPSLNSTIYTMKGNLLKLVGVKAFDSAATFVDPSGAALVLSDVMCSYCNEVRVRPGPLPSAWRPGMHQKGRGLRGGHKGGWGGGWRRLPKRLGPVTVGYKCH